MKQLGCMLLLGLGVHVHTMAQVDYTVISVPQETGTEFVQVTTDNDYVCMPQVRRFGNTVQWFTNKIIDVSPDGKSLAYLSYRNNTSNIFIREIGKKGAAVQRTNRQGVLDFSYSPDGRYICFSEREGKYCQIYQTSSSQGYVCRQITSNNKDYSPVYSSDMDAIFFTREEKRGCSIWSYSLPKNFLSNYTIGMNPLPIGKTTMLCTRFNTEGRGEIWRINIEKGTEECVLADTKRSFSTPTLSPDGSHILLVGTNVLMNGTKEYGNTDIFVCKTDGTDLRQLTFHAADDLSPVWSKDGKYIYFISQRGSAMGAANIWRMSVR